MAEKYLSGFCPNCFTKLDYEQGDSSVNCPGCDFTHSTSALLKSLDAQPLSQQPAAAGASMDFTQFIQSIETAESGLAYLENFFESFDWNEYNQTSSIKIPAINQMVEKNKVKNAASPQTWQLEFESIIVPLIKKIQGTKELETQMAEKYNPLDDTSVFQTFDTYQRNNKVLLAQKEELMKTLVLDVKYAEKYGASAETVDSMKARIVIADDMYKTVRVVKNLNEVPSVSEVIKKQERALVDKLAKQGINAEQTYARAVSSFNHSDDKMPALKDFQAVLGYKDSANYVKKINRFFNYNYELYNIGGKHYTTLVDKDEPLNVKGINNPNIEAEKSLKGLTVGLYEIVDGKPAKEAAVTGISYFIKSFGSRLIYIKNNMSICSFNTITGEDIELDRARFNDYKDQDGEYSITFSKDETKFFIRKKLVVQMTQPGCFAKLFGKKPEQIENKNNYSILLVDLKNNSIVNLIEEVIDVMDFYDDQLFYTYSSNPKTDDIHFMVCDINTRSRQKVLDESCEIHTVYNNKVIYSEWNPNTFNMNLYVYDLATTEKILLEDNIFDFKDVIEDKVYYTVGNKNYQPLFSIDFDGKNRREILLNVEKIYFVKSGWMYALKGYGRNRTLFKISTDGKRRITLCSNFNDIVKFINGYVYYTDTDGDLHIVRNDGKENKVLADNIVKGSIIIDTDKIYYMRYEYVGDNRNNYSLYSIDLEGHNVKKIAFDILNMRDFDEDYIYLSKREVETYEVTYPQTKKQQKNKEQNKFIESYTLKRYYSYNKATGEFKVLLTLGLPDDSYKMQSQGCGCMNKEVEGKKTFKLLPKKAQYKRSGVVAAGSNFKEANKELAITQPQNNGCGTAGQGCTGSNNTKSKQASGCAGNQKGKNSAGCGCTGK